jgi:hypothetical protein
VPVLMEFAPSYRAAIRLCVCTVWAATESRTNCVAPLTLEPMVTLPWLLNEIRPLV